MKYTPYKPFWPFRERAELVLAMLLLGSMILVQPRVEESDAIQYFSYLPSLLIDGDLDFRNEYERFYREDPEGRQGFKETFLDRRTETGLQINFGPIGTALLWSPFYLTTHGVLKLAGEPADGLSLPYRRAVTMASAFYAAIGLFFSFRLARRWATTEVSFLAVVALWWGTPVAYYMYVAPGMSHAASLFAVVLFFSLWPWAARGGSGRWAVWGASAGLMGLVRTQDVFIALAAFVPALSPSLEADVRGRLSRLLAFGITSILVFAPQLAVYQVLNGRPAPSQHVENKMYWLSPHFFEVLFSPRHGLFFWTPLLLCFLVGGLLFLRRQREAGLVLLIGFLSQIYLSGAVDSWTQAGAFGARRFVGTTVIFAVWGAFLMDALRTRLRLWGLAAVTSLFLFWNVSLMVQFGLGLMDRQRLVWSEVMHNHVYEVPPRLFGVVGRFLVDADGLAESGREPE